MDNAPIDKTPFSGISLQQIVLISVLEKLTQQKAPSIEGVDVDYSSEYQLVGEYCPNELNVLKKLAVEAG